jgi:hypothetical protein
LKKFLAGITLAVMVAVGGLTFAPTPATVHATTCSLSYPVVRTSITATVPYGGSAGVNDQYNVKVINTSPKVACADPIVTISPRDGMGFGMIVATSGGWTCTGPAIGDPGDTICLNSTLAPASSSTLRVTYNRISPVSGAATATLTFP